MKSEILSIPFGPDVFPIHWPKDAARVVLDELTNIPSEIYAVYWPCPVMKKWIAFIPDQPDWSALTALEPGGCYLIAAGGACEWEIPFRDVAPITDPIEASNLIITPWQVPPGTPVIISAWVTNNDMKRRSITINCEVTKRQ